MQGLHGRPATQIEVEAFSAIAKLQNEVEELKQTLQRLVHSLKPIWHYSMEQEGYECAHCRKTTKCSIHDFSKPEAHEPNCSWLAAKQLLSKIANGGK